MSFSNVVAAEARIALVLSLALGLAWLLRRRSAAARRVVLATALSGALILPALSALAPRWALPGPVAAFGARARALTEAVDIDVAPPSDARAATGVSGASAAAVSSLPSRVKIDWHAGVVTLWALGALRVLVRAAVGLARARRMVRRASPAVAWAAAVTRAERLTGLRADVRVSDGRGVPAVAGVWRAVILVPPAGDSWSDARRVAVLLHELAHVRQRDCLLHMVAQLACAAHWFNPLAWLAARRLGLERELAADEAVLVSGARASTYAGDLLDIARDAWAAGAVPGGALPMAEPSQLATRVAAIVGRPVGLAALSRTHAASLAGACAAGVAVVACSSAAPGLPSPAESASPSHVTAWSSGGATSVRPELQAIAEDELDRTIESSHAQGGAILVLDPKTGEILADAGRAGGARADVGVASAFVTGSTFKVVTLAAALEAGVVSIADRIDCEHGAWTYDGKVMHDSQKNGLLPLPEMLAVSSNIGISKIFDRVGGDALLREVHALHFGVAPPVDGAVAGSVPDHVVDHSFKGATVAIGEAISASPLQIAAVYAAIANGGEYVAPTRTRRNTPPTAERVMKPETARTLVTLLEGVVTDPRGTGRLARVEGARVAGKTGTAAWDLPDGKEGIYASFVGFVRVGAGAEADAPRYVVVVGVDRPTGESYGPTVAAPAFSRVVTRALALR